MILEVAILTVLPDKISDFESNFQEAQNIISGMNGFAGLQLQRCLEVKNRYILLVNWNELEDHTKGFRLSSKYQEWKQLLHHFYDPFPVVEHYSLRFEKSKRVGKG